MRDRLGWAVGDETPFVTTYQTAQVDGSTQVFFANRQSEAITLLPGGQGWLVAGFEQAAPAAP